MKRSAFADFPLKAAKLSSPSQSSRKPLPLHSLLLSITSNRLSYTHGTGKVPCWRAVSLGEHRSFARKARAGASPARTLHATGDFIRNRVRAGLAPALASL